jgi:peptide/nickel transport system permease protein
MMTGIKAFLRPVYAAALGLLAVIFILNLFAPFLAPFDPNEINMPERLQRPSREHFFGTDTLGRDVFSRVVWGGRASILLSSLATFFTMFLGLVVGILAGYIGGKVDAVILVITSMLQGIPGMSLMIALAGALGPGLPSLLLALVIISWPSFSRIVRGEVIKLREEEFIEGMRAAGAKKMYILIHHILPNMMGTVVVLFTTRIGFGILAIASLSFLGLGIQPPTPDWGVMVRDAMYFFREQPGLLLAPGGFLFLTTLSINLIGDALRDSFDVRSVMRREQI